MKKYTKFFSEKNQFTLLFYDYETFGTHASLDKPAQFASIRTDKNLKVIEKPQCFYCFPSDDYFPEPQSILITKITPQYTLKYGTNEHEFAQKIYNILMQPNTCIVGYNNIAFDDEITRNIFYRNFLDPYEWSWKNNNSRWDLLNIMRACYLLRPDGIKWPKNNLGLPIFKLSDLTRENNILHNAHDAINDVYATINLAKLVQKKQPKLFNFFFKYRKKNELYKLININNLQPILYITSYFGAVRNNMSFILPLFWDECNNNILIAIDLFKDIKKLINFFKNNHYQDINSKNLFDLGIVLIHFNRCPILLPIQLLRIEDAERFQLKNFSIDKKINLIKLNNFIINYIKHFFSKQNVYQDVSNVDLKLYHGFFSWKDKQLIKKISSSTSTYLKNFKCNFQDIRLKELFFRYKARNFIFILNSNEKKIWLNYCFQVFNRFFLETYINKIEKLLEEFSHDIEKVKLLNKLLEYTFKKYKILFYKNININ